MSTTAVSGRALSAQQLGDYEAEGYLVLRGVFGPAEIAEAAAEAEGLLGRRDLMDPDNLRCRWQPHAETGEKLFETFDPFLDLAPVCNRVAHDRRLLDVLADIYGEEACLFKDKLIYKPPGARGYGLHQDFIAWPAFPRSFITVVVSLDPSGPDNGCTEVFPGCHRNGCLSAEDGNYHELSLADVGPVSAVPLALQPGDVALFGCFTPHHSAPNRSGQWRRQLYLSYNAVSDGGDLRERHYQDFHRWLRERYAAHGKHDVYFR